MADQLSFNEILTQLKNQSSEKTVGNYVFKELTLKQQRQILTSTYEAVEIPARISNIYNNYIAESVSLKDDMVNLSHVVTVDKKPYLLNVLRSISLGDEYVPSEEEEETPNTLEDTDKVKTVYKIYEVTEKDLEAKSETPEDVVFGNFRFKLAIPTLAEDTTYNSFLLNALKPYRKKKISDADLGAVADVYQIYEMMKYIKTVTFENQEYTFSALAPSDKVKLLDSLPRSASDAIAAFIRKVKKNEDIAYSAISETGDKVVMDSNTLFFSKGNQ